MTERTAISTDILHFPARVLVIQAARLLWNGDPDPGHGSGHLLVRRAVPGSRPSHRQTHRVHGVHVERWSRGRVD